MAEKERYTWQKKAAKKGRSEPKIPEDNAGLGYVLVFLGIISVVMALLLRDTRIYIFSIASFVVGWWKLKDFSNND